MALEKFLLTRDGTKLYCKIFNNQHNIVNPYQKTLIVLVGGPGIDHGPMEVFWKRFAPEFQVVFYGPRGCEKVIYQYRFYKNESYKFDFREQLSLYRRSVVYIANAKAAFHSRESAIETAQAFINADVKLKIFRGAGTITVHHVPGSCELLVRRFLRNIED